ncbi:hypothetical protein I552_9564 [Mycobacterium xenopi 3993]|nr:hypothetical protein I552_9564 [Mycobacterium xenopi 3993]
MFPQLQGQLHLLLDALLTVAAQMCSRCWPGGRARPTFAAT